MRCMGMMKQSLVIVDNETGSVRVIPPGPIKLPIITLPLPLLALLLLLLFGPPKVTAIGRNKSQSIRNRSAEEAVVGVGEGRAEEINIHWRVVGQRKLDAHSQTKKKN